MLILTEFHNPDPNWIASILTWLIPAIELALAVLLIIQITRKKALWATLILLSLFTVYIGVVMTGIFSRVPCSCGGILKNMSYGTHLIFNLFFVLLTSLGLAIDNDWTAFYRLLKLKKRKGSIQSSVLMIPSR